MEQIHGFFPADSRYDKMTLDMIQNKYNKLNNNNYVLFYAEQFIT
jgi:hypothetical protein